MNEILSRDMTKMKSENSELKEENKKLVTEMNKLKSMQQFYRKNGRQNTAEGIETPPDSNASDKSKGILSNLKTVKVSKSRKTYPINFMQVILR
jgi:cell division septum initiation protein DivIVA